MGSSSHFESFYIPLFLLFKKQFFIHSSSYQGGAGAIIGPLLFSHTRYHHHWRTGLLSSSAHFLLIDSLGSKITHTSIRCEMWQFSSSLLVILISTLEFLCNRQTYQLSKYFLVLILDFFFRYGINNLNNLSIQFKRLELWSQDFYFSANHLKYEDIDTYSMFTWLC